MAPIPEKSKQMFILVAFGVFVAFGALAWNLFIKPLNQRITGYNLQMQTEMKKQNLLVEIGSLKKQSVVFGQSLCENKENAWLIEALNRLASESGITLVSVSPVGIEERGDCEKLTLRLEAKGGYHDVGDFSARIESLSKFVKVSNVHIEMLPGMNEPGEGLKISMSLSVFYPVKGTSA